MKKILIVLIVLMIGLISATPLFASESATKEECVAKVKEAVAMVKEIGLDATLEKVNDPNGPFAWKGNYLFCVDVNTGVMKAHPNPKLVGKNLKAIKDVTGKMFVMEYTVLAKEKGEGWTEYMWPKPGEKKPSKKVNYVHKVPGEDVLFGAGIFVE